MGLGALGLYGESQKDEQGYLNTPTERFAASTHALATENLDLDLDGVQDVVSSPDLGKVRLDVAPQSDKPVFVEIARTDQVTSYLSGVAHTTLTDLDYEPFEASYNRRGGERKPALPADQQIWSASTQGAGAQTLTWDVEDGDWSVVVMNADGSRGVQADVSAGSQAPLPDRDRLEPARRRLGPARGDPALRSCWACVGHALALTALWPPRAWHPAPPDRPTIPQHRELAPAFRRAPVVQTEVEVVHPAHIGTG